MGVEMQGVPLDMLSDVNARIEAYGKAYEQALIEKLSDNNTAKSAALEESK